MAVISDTQRCFACDTTKPNAEFHKDRTRPRGITARCKECSRTHYRDNLGRYRENHLRRKYGLTNDEWSTQLATQGGACAVCGSEDPRSVTGFHTDHDHETGAFRSLLCMPCNHTLGKLGDSPLKATAFVIYLATHGRLMSPTELRDFLRCYPVHPPRKPRKRLHHRA